jgi:PAS domain S-box-containing protein
MSQSKASAPGPAEDGQLYRRLVEAVTDCAIYMLDTGGHVTSWNAGAQRLKGYSPDEIIGQHFSRFYTEQDRAADLPARAMRMAASEGKFEAEGWRLRRDGSRFWAHAVIDSIRDGDGRLTGYAKVTRDLTERKEAQEKLEKAREALFQSQKMDAVGQLTGGVAHDFNNLLMAVLGSLELLRKRVPDDPQILRLLDNATLGARRGATLTQRMLAFARRQELNVQPLDLAKLVGGMSELLERSLGVEARLEIAVPRDLPRVRGDENQLELALLNLSVNARDAMPDGGVIRIGASPAQVRENDGNGHDNGLAPGLYVRLTVEDTGEGMDRDVLARATEPFFTTKGVGKGTGLGLSMVHGMAAQVGGRLLLRSQPGQGTVAEIWLPAAAGETAAVAINGLEAVPAPASALRILAVDDDGLVLFNTGAMLQDLGHLALEAASAEQALAILAREKVDMVITDQAMPRMTGAQLVEAIRVEWPRIPVILATGYAELPEGIGAGVTKLGKPFSEQELGRAIAAARRG